MENLYFATSEAEHALSFSAMVKDRFSEQLHEAIHQYAKLQNTELQSVTLTEVIVTALEREAVYEQTFWTRSRWLRSSFRSLESCCLVTTSRRNRSPCWRGARDAL